MINEEKIDNVNSPKHYIGDIETIDYIRDKLTDEGFVDYCIGNVIKYVSRHRGKNGKEDLEKAAVYLNWAIENYVEVESKNDEVETSSYYDGVKIGENGAPVESIESYKDLEFSRDLLRDEVKQLDEELDKYRRALEFVAFKQLNVEDKRKIVKYQSEARKALENGVHKDYIDSARYSTVPTKLVGSLGKIPDLMNKAKSIFPPLGIDLTKEDLTGESILKGINQHHGTKCKRIRKAERGNG